MPKRSCISIKSCTIFPNDSKIFIEINKNMEIDKNAFISYQVMCSQEPA